MKTKTSKGCPFACMECGYKFRSTKSAERAAFGPNGCPKCGGADIDIPDGPLAGAVAARKIGAAS